jgi:hypothetical protein
MTLSKFFSRLCTWAFLWIVSGPLSPCLAQSKSPTVDITQTLPKNGSVLNYGATTEVSVSVTFPSDSTETTEYTLLLSVNGCPQHAFKITLTPGLGGPVAVTWLVCVTGSEFITTVRLLAAKVGTPARYELAEKVSRFPVAFPCTLAFPCTQMPPATQRRFQPFLKVCQTHRSSRWH